MTKKLPRRSLLKMASVLAASGAVGWNQTDTAPVIGGDETVIVELEQPFAPYRFDGMTLRKAETDD